MTLPNLNPEIIADICRTRASEYRRRASRDNATENQSKAQALEQLANDLLSGQYAGSINALHANPDELAREIAPQAFADYEAMINRLRSQGYDEGHAIRSAQAVYGAEIEKAKELAEQSAANFSAASTENSQFELGYLAAAEWHEQKAKDAEILANKEPVPERRAKLRQRAERHKLYARTLRQDFEVVKAQRRQQIIENLRQAGLQKELPFGESGLSLEVQYAFLKRKGDLPDETFD